MLVGCLQGRRTMGAARETDDCARLQGPVRLQDDTGRYEAAGQAAAALAQGARTDSREVTPSETTAQVFAGEGCRFVYGSEGAMR